MTTFGSNAGAPSAFPGRSPSLLLRNSEVLGFTETQRQVDACVEGFVRQSTELKTLAPLVAGSFAYRLGRIGAMGFGSGNGIRLLSIGAGLAAEVSAFEGTHRALNLKSEIPNLWRWAGSGGLREGLLSSLVTFSTLKGFGRLTEGQNLIVQHTSQASAMVLGHQLAYRAGIGPQPIGRLAEQFLQAEATNLQLGAGMALSHRLSPGIQAWERGLDLSARQLMKNPPPSDPWIEASRPSLQFAFETRPVNAQEARPLDPLQLWTEGAENGGKKTQRSVTREDEVQFKEICIKFPRLGKELERTSESPDEKIGLLKKLIESVRNDAQYSVDMKLAGDSFEAELEGGLSIAANGLTAALKALSKVDWTPSEKWDLLKLFAEADRKFPELTFVGEAYGTLPEIFSAMNEAGWDPSLHRLFLEKVAREVSPMAVKSLPLAIRSLHRLEWSYEEQTQLYFSWAERSGDGQESIPAFVKCLEGFTSLGWSKEQITDRLLYLFEKSFRKKGKRGSIDYTDYFGELIHSSLLKMEKEGFSSEEKTQVLELLFEKSKTRGMDVFKVLYFVEWCARFRFTKSESLALLNVLIQRQRRIDGYLQALNGLWEADFSHVHKRQILFSLAESSDFHRACRSLTDFLSRLKEMKWSSEKRFQILSRAIDQGGYDLGLILRGLLPAVLAGLQKTEWDPEASHSYLMGLLEKSGPDLTARLKQEALALSFFSLSSRKKGEND